MQVGTVGTTLQDFGKGPIHIPHVPSGNFLTVEPCHHLQGVRCTGMPGLGLAAPGFQFIRGNQIGPQGCCKIFAFGGPQAEEHFLHLQGSSTPIVHNRVAGNAGIGIVGWDIAGFAAHHHGHFQLKVQLPEMVRHASHRARPAHRLVIGKIKNRLVVKFLDHRDPAIPASAFHMLAECVAIPAGCGPGDRR